MENLRRQRYTRSLRAVRFVLPVFPAFEAPSCQSCVCFGLCWVPEGFRVSPGGPEKAHGGPLGTSRKCPRGAGPKNGKHILVAGSAQVPQTWAQRPGFDPGWERPTAAWLQIVSRQCRLPCVRSLRRDPWGAGGRRSNRDIFQKYGKGADTETP